MNKNVFTLMEETPEQVILQVTAKTPLDIARHPYVSAEMEYITVTKGEDHTFTIIKTDGKTFSFRFGYSGYTLISSSLERLKNEVLSFIKINDIFLEARTINPPKRADVF